MEKLCLLIELSRKATRLNRSCKVAKAFGWSIGKLRALWTLLLHPFPVTHWFHSGSFLLAAHLLSSTEWWFAVGVNAGVLFFFSFPGDVTAPQHKLWGACQDFLKCYQKACSAVARATLQFSGTLQINFDLPINLCLEAVFGILHGVMLAARKVRHVGSVLVTHRQTKKKSKSRCLKSKHSCTAKDERATTAFRLH